MKRIGLGSLVLAFIAGLLFMGTTTEVSAQYTWTIGACIYKSTESGQGLLYFKDLLEKNSNGRIKIKAVHLAGEVCCQKTCIDQIDLKAIEIVEISDGNYGAFSKTLRVLELPYLFDNVETAGKILSGPAMDKLSAKVEKGDKRKLLTIITSGSGRHLWTNVPVKTPSDLKGRKIRAVLSPVENETIKIWGGIPTPVPWGELYQALQSKLVNGHLLQINLCEAMKGYEASPYCAEIDYKVSQVLGIFMNLDYWNSLPEDLKKVVQSSAREMQRWTFENARKFDNESKERIKKLGVTFYRPAPKEMKEWKESALKIWPRFKGECDEEVLNIILKAQNKTFPK